MTMQKNRGTQTWQQTSTRLKSWRNRVQLTVFPSPAISYLVEFQYHRAQLIIVEAKIRSATAL